MSQTSVEDERFLLRGDRSAVTDRAHLRVLAPQPLGVKARPVGIEPAAAERRMTGEAVTLGVAGDAGLQALPRGLAVASDEYAVRVVISRSQRTGAPQAGRCVAGRTEAGGVVTIAA
jgi:hypothetical protein